MCVAGAPFYNDWQSYSQLPVQPTHLHDIDQNKHGRVFEGVWVMRPVSFSSSLRDSSDFGRLFTAEKSVTAHSQLCYMWNCSCRTYTVVDSSGMTQLVCQLTAHWRVLHSLLGPRRLPRSPCVATQRSLNLQLYRNNSSENGGSTYPKPCHVLIAFNVESSEVQEQNLRAFPLYGAVHISSGVGTMS